MTMYFWRKNIVKPLLTQPAIVSIVYVWVCLCLLIPPGLIKSFWYHVWPYSILRLTIITSTFTFIYLHLHLHWHPFVRETMEALSHVTTAFSIGGNTLLHGKYYIYVERHSVKHMPLPCLNRLFWSGVGHLKNVPIYPWVFTYHATNFCTKSFKTLLSWWQMNRDGNITSLMKVIRQQVHYH